MSNATTISLSQGLTYKKRVIDAINRSANNWINNNSVRLPTKTNDSGEDVVVGAASRNGIDVKSEFEKWNGLKNHLRGLKVLLFKATDPIREKILRLADLKDELVKMDGLNTKDGLTVDPNGFRDDPVHYEAVISREQVESRRKECQNEIDNIQAEIDKFNHTTEIQIDKQDI